MSGGFLERWSRRKVDEGQPKAAPDKALPEVPAPESEPDATPILSDAELAALPRIEDLTSESSLAPFLRAGVPSGLKNAAMRKMWLLTPAIRDHNDCAVDYYWDWNTPGGVPGNGGPLEPEAVQKMLRGLTKPPPGPALEPQEAGEPETTAQPSSENISDETAPAPTDAQPRNAQAPVCVSQSGSEPAAAHETERRRRHGGAMPS